MKNKSKIDTKCVHGYDYRESTGAVSVPIYQSATFRHDSLDEGTGYSYSRLQNPTRQALEETMAALEGGADAIAFGTGLAAMTVLFECCLSPDDHIIATEDLYGGSIRLLRTIVQNNGVQVDFVDTSDIGAVDRAIKKNTKAVFVETPTNPMMSVTAISSVAQLTKKHGLKLIVDNTFLTPYFLQPLALGADIVVHSGTKFLGGHNDTLAGFLVLRDTNDAERMRYAAKTIGACLSPFDSWLLLRGIKTLAIRMERIQGNALEIAKFLAGHKRVSRVNYVGLPQCKGHDIINKEASGYGGMISFEVDSHKTVRSLLEKVELISFAESLGGVETLITFPSTQTHADVPEAERERRGITDRLMRLSVGIENISDLIEDLKRALE